MQQSKPTTVSDVLDLPVGGDGHRLVETTFAPKDVRGAVDEHGQVWVVMARDDGTWCREPV
jgi:hypothetical protein